MSPLALLMLAAQVALPSPRLPQPVCAGVQVLASGQKLPPRDLTFSSRNVLDLQLRARLRRDLQGDHTLRLKVLTPGGFLYQVITVPFVGAAPAPDPREPAGQARGDAPATPASTTTRIVEGYPRPLPVQRLEAVAGDGADRARYQLTATLPVAGTSITMSSLYGRWSVEPYLDGQTEPCGPAARFTIRD